MASSTTRPPPIIRGATARSQSHGVHAALPRRSHRCTEEEDHVVRGAYTNDFPCIIYKINPFWENIRTCINVKTLPDELEKAGIDWKYYANADQWMNALQAIRHVRFNPEMWAKVQPPENFIKDVKSGNLPTVSWLIPPESYNEHPGGGGVGLCR